MRLQAVSRKGRKPRAKCPVQEARNNRSHWRRAQSSILKRENCACRLHSTTLRKSARRGLERSKKQDLKCEISNFKFQILGLRVLSALIVLSFVVLLYVSLLRDSQPAPQAGNAHLQECNIGFRVTIKSALAAGRAQRAPYPSAARSISSRPRLSR